MKTKEINSKKKKSSIEIENKQKRDNDSKSLNKIDENDESMISGLNIPKFKEEDLVGKSPNASMVKYLNDKIRFLETENKQLWDEVTKNHSFTEKEKINYYLRLRKELVEENEKLVSEKSMMEMNYKTQIEKMAMEIKDLRDQIKIFKTTDEEKYLNMLSFDKTFNQTVISNKDIEIKTEENKLEESKIEKPKEELPLGHNSKFFRNLDKELRQEEEKGQLTKLLKEQKERQVGPKNSIYNLNKKDHNNPFIPVIDDLEERVKLLEKTIREKDADIMELNEVISTNEQIAARAQASLQMEINKWKEKYLLILATRKTISQEFSELNTKTIENIKQSMSKTTYDMESKILHLEKMNIKLNDDMKAMLAADHDIDHQKVTQINNLKKDLKNLMDNYDDLYHNYEDSLQILTKQIDSIKQLYLSREQEFINLTTYYIETINEFTKPVTDIISNPSNMKMLEESLIIQNKQTEEMRKTAEKYIKENSMIKSENFESKAIMRQKINDAMKFYDDTINNISDNHKSIEEKLSKIIEFMEVFDEKFVFFNSLIEEKKTLTDKINELEISLRRASNDDQYKELLSLREGNLKMSKELEAKVQLLKEMEEIQEAIFANQTDNNLRSKSNKYNSISNNDNFAKRMSISIQGQLDSPKKKNYNKAKEVSFDTVMKMKAEIAILSSKIVELSRSKEEIEGFYQEEIRKLLANIEEKNETIDDLKSALTRNENEHFSKKETIFNLWMIEFKEFKENLISISDIKATIDKFRIEGGELKIQRDKLVSEEIYLLRQEIKTKDKSIIDLKSNYKKENTNLNEMLDQYKKGIDQRMNTLDQLIQMKNNEINAIKNEKKRLLNLEARKKEVSEF